VALFVAARVSLETDPAPSDQTRLRPILDSHQPAIAEHDLLTATLSKQFLIFPAELGLQGSNLPVGFCQIEPGEFVD
jgi:hypothetical protein